MFAKLAIVAILTLMNSNTIQRKHAFAHKIGSPSLSIENIQVFEVARLDKVPQNIQTLTNCNTPRRLHWWIY